MDHTIKYKEDANIGMVSYKDALTVTINADNQFEAIKAFGIQKINEGFTNGQSAQTLIDNLNAVVGESENMIHEVNKLELMKDGIIEFRIIE